MEDEELIAAIAHDDKYRVTSVLSKGGSGAVGSTELVMRGDEGPFVRKRIPAAIANREAWETLAQADDELLPNVVDIYELPDELVVVYEYLEGEPLDQMMARRGVLLPAEAARIAVDVALAAQRLHERGIVHRDISPGNVIVCADGARLTDLGIARRQTEGAAHDTTRLGTWGFAAPEQYGFASTDERSDVWSMGRLLAYMLTGIVPGEEGFDERLADERYVPAEFAGVIAWACAFEPSARLASADEFAKFVRLAADGESAAGDGSAGEAGVAQRASAPESSQPAARSADDVKASILAQVAAQAAAQTAAQAADQPYAETFSPAPSRVQVVSLEDPAARQRLARLLGADDIRQFPARFINASAVQKILLVMLLLIVLFVITVLSFFPFRQENPSEWGVLGDSLFVLAFNGAVFFAGLDLSRLILQVGPYAPPPTVVHLLRFVFRVVRILIVALVIFIMSMLVAIALRLVPF